MCFVIPGFQEKQNMFKISNFLTFFQSLALQKVQHNQCDQMVTIFLQCEAIYLGTTLKMISTSKRICQSGSGILTNTKLALKKFDKDLKISQSYPNLITLGRANPFIQRPSKSNNGKVVQPRQNIKEAKLWAFGWKSRTGLKGNFDRSHYEFESQSYEG